MLKSTLELFLPPRVIQKLLYYRAHKHWPNLKKPQRFTEKVFWRKFHDRNPLYTSCTDKLAVRDFVANRVGTDVLVPLLFQSANPEDLWKLESWRNSVIKANHGFRMMAIINEKEPTDIEKRKIIADAKHWLSSCHSSVNGELHYIGIEPRLMVELFVGDANKPPLDCKVHCFQQHDGNVKIAIQLIADRFFQKSMYYYKELVSSETLLRTTTGHPINLTNIQLKLIEDAIERSKILSSEFEYVRVDWMITAERVFFSELTFTPGSGLSRSMGPELDFEFGSWWQQNQTLSTRSSA